MGRKGVDRNANLVGVGGVCCGVRGVRGGVRGGAGGTIGPGPAWTATSIRVATVTVPTPTIRPHLISPRREMVRLNHSWGRVCG